MSRAAGEFREGDTVRRVERDGRPSSPDFEVTHAFEDSHSLWLYGSDYGRGTGNFADSAFWSSGEPKYELVKSIEEKVAEELMA